MYHFKFNILHFKLLENKTWSLSSNLKLGLILWCLTLQTRVWSHQYNMTEAVSAKTPAWTAPHFVSVKFINNCANLPRRSHNYRHANSSNQKDQSQETASERVWGTTTDYNQFCLTNRVSMHSISCHDHKVKWLDTKQYKLTSVSVCKNQSGGRGWTYILKKANSVSLPSSLCLSVSFNHTLKWVHLGSALTPLIDMSQVTVWRHENGNQGTKILFRLNFSSYSILHDLSSVFQLCCYVFFLFHKYSTAVFSFFPSLCFIIAFPCWPSCKTIKTLEWNHRR